MLRYIAKRIILALPVILGLLTITFFVTRLAPGDPATLFLESDFDPKVSEHLREAMGLNDPLHVQYGKWCWNMITGDFGVSFTKHRPVLDVLAETIPNTLLLTSLALLVNLGIGIILGAISAMKRGTRTDQMLRLGSLFLYAMPEFWLALMLLLLVSLQWDLLPASQMYSPDADQLPFFEKMYDLFKHLILPVSVLGIASASATGRYIRGSFLDVLGEDYIRTARAKGLSEFVVLRKHALRNALIPLITIVGLSLPFLLGGAVIVEGIFAWPGMGSLTLAAISSRDYPLVIACTFVAGCLVVLGNLFADVLYVLADPKIKLKPDPLS